MLVQPDTVDLRKPSQVVLNFGTQLPSLLLDLDSRMILGRRGLQTDEFVVDLTLFNAYELGVSRKHALLYIKNGQVFIEDLGSDEGTQVNNNRLIPFKPYPISSGAVIKLGRLTLKLWSDFKYPGLSQ